VTIHEVDQAKLIPRDPKVVGTGCDGQRVVTLERIRQVLCINVVCTLALVAITVSRVDGLHEDIGRTLISDLHDLQGISPW
jgi:hypothetical protein